MNQLSWIDVQKGRIEGLSDKTLEICRKLEQSHTKAQKLTSMLRQLDQEQLAIGRALNSIEDAQELKENLVCLNTAMEDKEYETAAGIVHRYLFNPHDASGDLLESELFQIFVLPAATAPGLNAKELLSSHRNDLTVIVSREFLKAVQQQSQKDLRRYFKLFPMIGESLMGLQLYADFLCDMVGDRCKQRLAVLKIRPMIFADAFKELFELIARAIDHHFPLVETHYGPGKMTYIINRLQGEGERQARRLLDMFEEERQPQRLSEDLDKTSSNQTGGLEMDLKLLDNYLNELAFMNQKYLFYTQFIESRLLADTSHDAGGKTVQMEPVVMVHSIKERLSGLMMAFANLEKFFFRRSLARAMQAAENWNSYVEDAFFIIKKVFLRIIATCEFDIMTGLMKLIMQTLENELLKWLYQRAVNNLSFLDLSALSPPPPQITAIICLLTCCENIPKLNKELISNLEKLVNSANLKNWLGGQKSSIVTTINMWQDKVYPRTLKYYQSSLDQLFDVLFKPKLRTMLQRYAKPPLSWGVLSEEQFEEQEFHQSSIKSFLQELQTLIGLVKNHVATESDIFTSILGMMVKYIQDEWEKLILASKFNLLGALKLDKDVRLLRHYLLTLEQKLPSRLLDICQILNLEELNELETLGHTNLPSELVQKILATRWDLLLTITDKYKELI